MIWRQLLCVGDSQTSGSRTPCGWPELLNAAFRDHDTGCEWVGLNESVAGETSAHILRRLPSVLRSHPNAHIVALMMGTNDARDKMEVWASESIFRSALVLVRSAGKLPVALIPPAMLRGVGHVTAGDTGYTRDAADLLDGIRQMQRTIAQELEVAWANVELERHHYLDAVHFSMEGHKRVAQLAAELVVSL